VPRAACARWSSSYLAWYAPAGRFPVRAIRPRVTYSASTLRSSKPVMFIQVVKSVKQLSAVAGVITEPRPEWRNDG
jgi:hypothetical protein